MKQARIYYKDRPAGFLTEGDNGYQFAYLPGANRTNREITPTN
jgi:hypothetical protein